VQPAPDARQRRIPLQTSRAQGSEEAATAAHAAPQTPVSIWTGLAPVLADDDDNGEAEVPDEFEYFSDEDDEKMEE
jgi:hypothetical protein